MNKRLIALAVAAAVSAPAVALADDSTVTIYGTLNADFENVKAKGGTAAELKQRNRVSSNSSNIGFKGVEPLGGGLDAIFQVESAVNLDAGDSTWASRNSGVGLKGGFGTAIIGRWDSAYKVSTLRVDPFGDGTIGAYTGIVGGNSQANAGNVAASRSSFDRRVSNSLSYISPTFSGVTIRATYGANEEKATVGTTTTDPSLASAAVTWEGMPGGVFVPYVGAAYETHKDAGGDGADDKGYKAFGGFSFANGINFGLIWERLKYDGPDAAGAATALYKGTLTPGNGGLEVTSWYASVGWKGGPNSVAVAYGADQKVKLNGTEDSTLKARQISLRYAYDLSKRTQFYALATEIKNKDNSSNTFGQNPLAVSAGQDPRGFGVGVIHKF